MKRIHLAWVLACAIGLPACTPRNTTTDDDDDDLIMADAAVDSDAATGDSSEADTEAMDSQEDDIEPTDTEGSDGDASDAADASGGFWDIPDPRITYHGRCTTSDSFACDGSTLVECHCVRDDDSNCLYKEEYRIDCATVYPDTATCQVDRCAVEPGGQCFFTTEELGLPPQNPLWGLIEIAAEGTGFVAPCAGTQATCVIEADGVGRCRENAPVCDSDYPDGSTLPAPGITECTGPNETIQVLECEDARGDSYLMLGRECESETCGSTCSGVLDGQPCVAVTSRGTGTTWWGRQLPCGPFSRCDLESELCTPRVCVADDSGACANTQDCDALSAGLEAAYDVVLACLEQTDTTFEACLVSDLSVSQGCAQCFADLEGDFEACAGF